jgi:hypothetical protein
MAAPKAPLSPNTLSIGISTRLIQIISISPDGTMAICADRSGYEARVPMYSQRAKGFLPQAGENWIISRDVAQQDGWNFLQFIGSGEASFQPLGYSGGALVQSNASDPGTDLAGNAFLTGHVTYWQSGGMYLALAQQGPSMKYYSAPAAGGPWTLAPSSGYWAADSPNRGTLAPDPNLTVTCLPNMNYFVEVILFQTSASPGIQFNFSIPAGATGRYGIWEYSIGQTFQAFDSAWTTTNTAGIASSRDTPILFRGFLDMANPMGQLTFNWGQNGSGSATLLRQGSALRLVPVN